VFRELRGLSLDHDGAVTVEQVDASLAIRDGLLALAVGFSAAIVLTFAFGVAVRAAGQAPAPFLHGSGPSPTSSTALTGSPWWSRSWPGSWAWYP
jgi:hypothetical protein